MAAALLIGAAAAAAGQQAPAPVAVEAVQADALQGVPAVLPGTPMPLPEAPPTTLWSVAIPAAPITSPLIAADHVLVSYEPGIIAAHRVADGTQAWQATLTAEPPLVADGGMLLVASGGAIHALRIANGAVAWVAQAGALTAPLLARDGWVLSATASTLTARRTSDGSVVWSVDAPLQREAAAISGNSLFVPSVDGRLRMLDLTTGAVIWERRLGASPGEPLVIGDSVLFGASDKYFYSIKARDGGDGWKSRVGAAFRGRPSTDGERVYFTALDNLVRGLDLRRGQQRWQTGLPFRPLTGPVVAGGTVFVSGSGTEVRMLRAESGASGGAVSFPARLANAPGLLESAFGVEIAAVTGGLDESWSLQLTRPVRIAPVIVPVSR